MHSSRKTLPAWTGKKTGLFLKTGRPARSLPVSGRLLRDLVNVFARPLFDPCAGNSDPGAQDAACPAGYSKEPAFWFLLPSRKASVCPALVFLFLHPEQSWEPVLLLPEERTGPALVQTAGCAGPKQARHSLPVPVSLHRLYAADDPSFWAQPVLPASGMDVHSGQSDGRMHRSDGRMHRSGAFLRVRARSVLPAVIREAGPAWSAFWI